MVLGLLAVASIGVPVGLTRHWIAATSGPSATDSSRARRGAGVAPPPSAPGRAHSGTWQPDHAYQPGDTVTFDGHSYRCRQGHTSQLTWEPPNVPALWLAL